ncbi:MAG: BTAD domain-containing putative transcriptional regulator [Caldimonas sp.]
MDALAPAWRLLREGLALADGDIGAGRAALRDALARFDAARSAPGRLLAGAALVQCIGIAEDDYAGFEDAVAAVHDSLDEIERIDDAGDRLSAQAGALVAGWFRSLDDPALPAQAEAIVRRLGETAVAAPVRARAGLSALGFFEARLRLEDALWVELAMRPVLADASVGARLADEWHHMLVQACYQCGAPERAQALRAQRSESGVARLPVIALKALLLEAQLAIGDGRSDAGRAALAATEPLLSPQAPRPASWWHLLSSRLYLVDGRLGDALIHARLSLRLAQESRLPDRWMGVTVMQEGQVQLAAGRFAEAAPFFERAARASSGTQADFCTCLAHFAHALDGLDAGKSELGRDRLRAGFALARGLQWTGFLRALPRVAASLCASALEYGIESEFVREVIAKRGLEAVRADLAAWPWSIRIVTLGRFAIELEGKAIAFRGKVAKKPIELLQFIIASSGSDVSTATATFALWHELDGDNAKAALNVALHRLRKLLGSDDAVLLELGHLSLNTRRVWVDCLAFEQLADRGVIGASAATAAAEAAQRALGLYGGPFLKETDDHAWQLVCRTRLASKFKRMVELRVRAAVAEGDTRSAQSVLERALEFDPLAEDMTRALMKILIDGGEQAGALVVFERCREAIFDGLGAKPAPATLALLDRFRFRSP